MQRGFNELLVCTANKQVTRAARGPSFFDRPKGDKKEAKRFQNSETKKKKGLFVPLDKGVSMQRAAVLDHE